jgi:hypothetical protein
MAPIPIAGLLHQFLKRPLLSETGATMAGVTFRVYNQTCNGRKGGYSGGSEGREMSDGRIVIPDAGGKQ